MSHDSRETLLGPPLGRVAEPLGKLSPYRVPPEPPPIKLDANESPFLLAKRARDAIGDAVSLLPLHRYPDGRARELRRILAERLDASPDELLLGTGSDEVITVLMCALSRPRGGEAASVLYPGPTFVMYSHSAHAHGLHPVEVPLKDDWSLDVDAMRAAFDRHRPSLAFYATPNNPTGNTFDDGALSTLFGEYPDTVHVLDEAYGAFDRDESGQARWRHGRVRVRPNVVALGTLSKIGLAGARIGWVRAHPALINELEKVRQPFNLDSLAQTVAAIVLRDHYDELERNAKIIVAERRRVMAALRARGHELDDSQANFFLLHVEDGAAERARLLEHGVAVRAFSDPRLATRVRITLGTPDENDALLALYD